jgi:hypothetical protein
MRDYAQRVPDIPDIDPLENPVGFWAMFGVLAIIVILLAVGPLFFIVSVVRANRGKRDPHEAAVDEKFDKVAAEQRRLDEQLKKLPPHKRPPPPG